MAAPKYTTRKGAAQDEPSMLWIGKSGRYYRNIVHAKIDNPANAINSNSKSVAAENSKAATTNVFFIIIAILVILILIKILK